jgi:uncharacterized protein with FMN-binding domain
MKKFLFVLLIVSAVLLIIMLIFRSEYNQSERKIRYEYSLVSDIDLNEVKDGVYPGKFIGFPVKVELTVTVKSHKIEKIDVQCEISGNGYSAKGLPDRIIKAQKIRVDAVTGATTSSQIIMIAVYRALQRRSSN